MCGRFTITRRDANALAAELGVDAAAFADYRPRYNVAPMQRHVIVRLEYENRKAEVARWGLVNRWAKDASQAARCINARAESVEARPAFRDAFRKRRCVIPADGFFEWTGPKTARRPIWFHRGDGGLLLFAGLYEAWQKQPEHWETTFTIITTSANATMAPYHDRMPVILSDSRADDWMNPQCADAMLLKPMLRPAPDDLLITTPVSSKLNSPKFDSPELLEETG
ncbi:MAG TPA: SOS response-associated peptidase [Candidatus Binataceae bacterium]|nr:SOS response-associated peptidase [Candidatus Binataceae bacterium]